MAPAFKCDLCGRFQSGKPVMTVARAEFQVTLRVRDRIFAQYENTSFVTETESPDLCPTCLSKKIIAICNEALAAQSSKK